MPCNIDAPVGKLVKPPPFQGGHCEFEPRRVYNIFMRGRVVYGSALLTHREFNLYRRFESYRMSKIFRNFFECSRMDAVLQNVTNIIEFAQYMLDCNVNDEILIEFYNAFPFPEGEILTLTKGMDETHGYGKEFSDMISGFLDANFSGQNATMLMI
jgi:hypothetical protein